MFTVTLIGPDGVGKTTVSKELQASLKLPIKYIYMGMNVEASNVMLPTTRWWENRKKNKGRGMQSEGPSAYMREPIPLDKFQSN